MKGLGSYLGIGLKEGLSKGVGRGTGGAVALWAGSDIGSYRSGRRPGFGRVPIAWAPCPTATPPPYSAKQGTLVLLVNIHGSVGSVGVWGALPHARASPPGHVVG